MCSWYIVLIVCAVILIGCIILGICTSWRDCWGEVCWQGWVEVLTAVFAIMVGVMGGICLVAGCVTRSEVHSYKYKKEMIEITVSNGSDLENIGITETIIEYNQWLTNAKASVDLYGTWTFYWDYKDQINDMEYVTIVRE